MDHRQTNTQSIRHTEMTNKRNKFLSSHSSLIIELQLWSHYHSPIIIIIIYWPDWNRSCSGGRRTSVLKGDLVVVHVEPVVGCAHHGKTRERGGRAGDNLLKIQWQLGFGIGKRWGEKRGIERDKQHLWCPQSVSYTHLTLPTTPYV